MCVRGGGGVEICTYSIPHCYCFSKTSNSHQIDLSAGLDWLATKPLGSSCLLLLSPGITDTGHHASLFYMA